MSYSAMAWARAFKTGSATTKAVLLAVANYADEEGVCWPSQEQLAEDTELSRHSIMRALDQLEGMGLLERERRHRKDGSRSSDLIMLDLSRTELRSTDQRSSEQRSTQQQPKSHGATAEPVIEPSIEKTITRAKPDSKRGTRLPDDFEPDASCWALAERLNLTSQHCQNELDQFRDYWRSVPGAKGLKLDWQATFRTWLRKSAERKPHGPNRQRDTSIAGGFAELRGALETAEARLAAERDGRGREDTLALPGLRKSAA